MAFIHSRPIPATVPPCRSAAAPQPQPQVHRYLVPRIAATLACLLPQPSVSVSVSLTPTP